ncbi:MAG TPA: SDR family NAD(P)-dependent oxidoreductase [Egibacteraceae bacterium]|nr:SDR family NAD(P)-dependent oxidoreductase [Egibacteraceae bacterium]
MSRTVLVTGGNKGIGRACAERFAADGHRVIVTGRDEAALAAVVAANPGVEPLAFDVTDEAAWAGLDVDIDILVANAGIAESAPVQKTTLEQWRRIQEVNVTGVFLGVRRVLPGMRERQWGRIVAVASAASHHGVRYASAYAASKHAVLGLGRSVAAEVAGTAVTANCVCPGYVKTQMTERSVERVASVTGRGQEQARAAIEGMQPLGRLVEPEEVADAVAYLAGERAAAVNGQSIILDGGGVQQ